MVQKYTLKIPSQQRSGFMPSFKAFLHHLFYWSCYALSCQATIWQPTVSVMLIGERTDFLCVWLLLLIVNVILYWRSVSFIILPPRLCKYDFTTFKFFLHHRNMQNHQCTASKDKLSILMLSYLCKSAHEVSKSLRVRTLQLLNDLKALVQLREHIHHRAREESMFWCLLEL